MTSRHHRQEGLVAELRPVHVPSREVVTVECFHPHFFHSPVPPPRGSPRAALVTQVLCHSTWSGSDGRAGRAGEGEVHVVESALTVERQELPAQHEA